MPAFHRVEVEKEDEGLCGEGVKNGGRTALSESWVGNGFSNFDERADGAERRKKVSWCGFEALEETRSKGMLPVPTTVMVPWLICVPLTYVRSFRS